MVTYVVLLFILLIDFIPECNCENEKDSEDEDSTKPNKIRTNEPDPNTSKLDRKSTLVNVTLNGSLVGINLTNNVTLSLIAKFNRISSDVPLYNHNEKKRKKL